MVKEDINELINYLSGIHFIRKMMARKVSFNIIFSAFEKLNCFGYVFRICWKSSNFYIRRTNGNHHLYGNHGLFFPIGTSFHLYGNHGLFSSRDVIWWTLYWWNKASFIFLSQIQINASVLRGACLGSLLNISETWRIIRLFPCKFKFEITNIKFFL